MKLLVSSCLLGENVRYDGSNNLIESELFDSIIKNNIIYPFCPEVQGGLSTPRIPAEILSDRVITKEGVDVTNAFDLGAKKALELCQKEGIKIALLKAKSPSCGNYEIYDGTFTKQLIQKSGITAHLLQKHGIKVFNENELDLLQKFIEALNL